MTDWLWVFGVLVGAVGAYFADWPVALVFAGTLLYHVAGLFALRDTLEDLTGEDGPR